MASATMTETNRVGVRPLRDSLYGDLTWRRPALLRRELLLEAGSEVVARLRWESPWRTEALGETADGRWAIARQGIASLHPQVIVRDAATQALVATYTSERWRHTGVLRFAAGAEYRWRREGFWRAVRIWSSADAERLVAFRMRLGWSRRYEMEVDPGALRVPALPVLVLLGAYLMSVMTAHSHAH